VTSRRFLPPVGGPDTETHAAKIRIFGYMQAEAVYTLQRRNPLIPELFEIAPLFVPSMRELHGITQRR